jgi:shikimate kinase
MVFNLDLVNAVAKDLGPAASLVLSKTAKVNLGKTTAQLTVADVDKIAEALFAEVSKTLGPAIAQNVKNNVLALKK